MRTINIYSKVEGGNIANIREKSKYPNTRCITTVTTFVFVGKTPNSLYLAPLKLNIK